MAKLVHPRTHYGTNNRRTFTDLCPLTGEPHNWTDTPGGDLLHLLTCPDCGSQAFWNDDLQAVPVVAGEEPPDKVRAQADEILRLRQALTKIHTTIYAGGAPLGSHPYFVIREVCVAAGCPVDRDSVDPDELTARAAEKFARHGDGYTCGVDTFRHMFPNHVEREG